MSGVIASFSTSEAMMSTSYGVEPMLCAPGTRPDASSRSAEVVSRPRSTSTAVSPGRTS
jgi:hypothetical protein